MAKAAERLPIGTVYPVWTGISAYISTVQSRGIKSNVSRPIAVARFVLSDKT